MVEGVPENRPKGLRVCFDTAAGIRQATGDMVKMKGRASPEFMARLRDAARHDHCFHQTIDQKFKIGGGRAVKRTGSS